MDPDVAKALARWPNVPAAYGWLSLTARGQWRFHAEGLAAQGGPGDQITNDRITAFIDRNYDRDARGNWFFQNGPQRAYVRLDVAPFVMRYDSTNDALVTHTGARCGAVSHWWLDETGRLYASTEIGPCAVDDRDLMTMMDDMRLDSPPPSSAQSVLELLDTLLQLKPDESMRVTHRLAAPAVPITRIKADDLETTLAFVRCPLPSPSGGEPSAR